MNRWLEPARYTSLEKVANSVTANFPLTVVVDPAVDKLGDPVAHVTTSLKLVFICEATIEVPAVKLFVTAKAAI
jgi:hypothetical protein